MRSLPPAVQASPSFSNVIKQAVGRRCEVSEHTTAPRSFPRSTMKENRSSTTKIIRLIPEATIVTENSKSVYLNSEHATQNLPSRYSNFPSMLHHISYTRFLPLSVAVSTLHQL